MESQKHRDVANALIEVLEYPEDNRVRAVFLVGSSASGETDQYSDIDLMVAVNDLISDEERLERLRAIGCKSIMLAIAGQNNPALPVKSQVIDKFVFHDTWFDVSYHLPGQLAFDFDCAPLLDKDGIAPQVCQLEPTYDDAELKARVQADLRLLHVRIHRYEKYALRKEWVGLDLKAIKNAIVDIVMVLNDQPNYNRFDSHITQMLRTLPAKPAHFEQDLIDIVRLDDRHTWQRKVETMQHMEADLTALCEARWGPIPLFDDQDADSPTEEDIHE
jgi:predicted nucleotidyltransferase